VLAIDTVDHARATEIINRVARVNRVIAVLAQTGLLTDVKVRRSSLSPQRLERLRRADAIVRRLSQESGFDARIWQFPVVLIPAGTEQQPDSVVLRPIDSVDGMTAAAVPIPDAVAEAMTRDLLAIPGIHSVFLDLTHKPPATIEWE
jgi:GMP synthase (glutamine-hydrolysing)